MAFLGIRVPHETGRLLSSIDVPGEKEGASEYHITILCFEDNWPITEIAKAMEATYNVVSTIKPFLVETNSVKCFPRYKDEPIAVTARIDSNELHKLNEKLKKEFDKQNIKYSKTFKDYNPHITLAYTEEKVDDFDIDAVEFSVQEVVLWGGDHGDDRIFITFPLQGPQKQKRSLLIQKADIFEKLANNPPQDHLTASYERRKIIR
jgi:2'-5' RNA ligase